VYCRILVDNFGADWPLAKKFGTTVEHARTLMLRAADLGLDPIGLSFHVGSQQTTTEAYEAAISKVGMLFTDLKAAGVNVRMVNLGGGYPIRYRTTCRRSTASPTPSWAHGGAFRQRPAGHDRGAGRFIVGDAGVVSSEVVLVCQRAPENPVRWVYLDIGRFGGLAETEGEAIRYRIATPHDGGETGPVAIAGRPATASTSCMKRPATACRWRSPPATRWRSWPPAPT